MHCMLLWVWWCNRYKSSCKWYYEHSSVSVYTKPTDNFIFLNVRVIGNYTDCQVYKLQLIFLILTNYVRFYVIDLLLLLF